MGKRNQKNLRISFTILAAFVLWTFAVRYMDVQPIGPNGSTVGFAALNGFVHKTIGVHWLTDIIGGVLLSVGLVMLYAAVCGSVTVKE